jgi:methionine-rich copper-binding protein CopC
MTSIVRILITLACLVVGAASAWAHAHLARAQPSAELTLREAPKEVRLWFSEALEVRLSEIHVWDARRQRVDENDLRLDPSDGTLLIVSLRALPVGTYRVAWKAVSRDGHTTHGEYGFTVMAPA